MSELSIRSVDEQVNLVLDGVGTLESIELMLLDAQGLQLAEPVLAPFPLPGFDSAATDGYAVRSMDLRGADDEHPVVLPVVGDVVAGSKSRAGMGPGLAMRIGTGAPIPAGADAVVPLAQTDRGVAKVSVQRRLRSGENIRRTGEDLATGASALAPGTTLGPQQLALLAAVGQDRVVVRPRPRVLVISTGAELVEVGSTPAFGEVIDSNSFLITAAVRDAGGEAYRVGIVPDDHARLLDVLETQLLRADILITTGGISDGPFDIVRQTLGDVGTVEFATIAMAPGPFLGFGHLGNRVPIFCLPGDPGAALASFEVFVRPAIRALLGKRVLHRTTVAAVTLDRVASPAGVRDYRRGLLHRESNGDFSVSFLGGERAHLSGVLAASNSLVVIDEPVTEVVAGSRVNVIPLMLSAR